MTRSSSNKLISLEAGRFIAAAGVMLFHYTAVVADFRGVTVFGDIFRPGHAGVPYFFVLSGFIIYHVHRADLGHPETLGRFIIKRAVRLFPMFLAVSLVMLLGFLIVPGMAGDRPLTPIGVVTDLLLLPHADSILSISWTLRHEIVFYALFALALCFGARAFWAVAAWTAISVVAGLYAMATGVDTVPRMGSWSVVSSTLNMGFGLGMIVAANMTKTRTPAWPLLCLGGAMMLTLCGLEWVYGRGVAHQVDVLGAFGALGYLLGAASLIAGLVKLETHWRMPAPGFWKVAGGSSYLLYLIHQPLASIAMRLLRRVALPPEVIFVILALLAIGVAVALHLTVEKWILQRLSGLGRPRPAAQLATDPAISDFDASGGRYGLTPAFELGQSHPQEPAPRPGSFDDVEGRDGLALSMLNERPANRRTLR